MHTRTCCFVFILLLESHPILNCTSLRSQYNNNKNLKKTTCHHAQHHCQNIAKQLQAAGPFVLPDGVSFRVFERSLPPPHPLVGCLDATPTTSTTTGGSGCVEYGAAVPTSAAKEHEGVVMHSVRCCSRKHSKYCFSSAHLFFLTPLTQDIITSSLQL